MTNNKPTLLVTGASGHLGRRVVEILLAAKTAATIVATTRTPEKLAGLREQGVVVRRADFNQLESLTEAFKGVDRLLLISTDELGEPGLRLKQHRAAVKAAETAGVQHVLYTSLINAGESAVLFAPDHKGTEDALAASSMGWTILRNNLYTDLLISSLSRAVQMGQLFSASEDGRTAYVTREDCAQAAAAALASDFSGRRTLDITGPEALSRAELAELATKITGTPVTYVPISLDVLTQNMVAAGLPEPIAKTYASIDKAIALGQLNIVSDAVAKLTGQKPISVEAFLTEHHGALVS